MPDAVPAGRTAGRPDILILLTDQQQAAAMSAAGNPDVRTPAMDALAAMGIRFTHAFCAAPQCSPSRGSLLTGRYPHRTGVMGNVAGGDEGRSGAGLSPPLDPRVPGLGSVFAAAGYETAYFGKWHLGGSPAAHGFRIQAATRGTEEVTQAVVDYLRRRQSAGGQRAPFFLIASYLNPHEIYRVKGSHAVSRSRATRVALPQNLADDLRGKPFPQREYLEADQGQPYLRASPDDWRHYRAFYYELVEKADREIGLITQAARAADPGALIVFSSDHGDLAGAHGLPFKCPAMYEELVRVPLIISWPGHLAAGTRDAMVNNIDLLPTLCDLAAIVPPAGLDGRSLGGLLRRDSAAGASGGGPEDAVFSEYYGKQKWRVPIRMVRTRDWKYVRTLQYGEELYDLRSDSGELRNLAAQPATAARRRELAARLDEWMKRTADPFAALGVTDRQGKWVLAPAAASRSPGWPALRRVR